MFFGCLQQARNPVVNDIVIDLLEWVSETSLRQSLNSETNERLSAGLESSLYVQEKCIKASFCRGSWENIRMTNFLEIFGFKMLCLLLL
jgi:hypothetical protein